MAPPPLLVIRLELSGEGTLTRVVGDRDDTALRVATYGDLKVALEAWIEGRLFWDTGSDLGRARVCLLPLPVLCPSCAMRYGAVLYGVARFSDKRPWLPDVGAWVGSALFHQDVFWAVEKTVAASGGKLGRIIEPWRMLGVVEGRDGVHAEWSGPKRWSSCPRCGAPAPGYDLRNDDALMLPKRQAVRAPLQEFSFEAACQGMLGLKFPAWRIMPRQDAPKRFSEGEWAGIVKRASACAWAAAERTLEDRRRRQVLQARLDEERALRTGNASSRRQEIVRAAAELAIGRAMDPEAREEFLDAWMERKLDGWWLEGSPAEIAAASPEGCRKLRLQIEKIARLAWLGGPSGHRALSNMVQLHRPDSLGLPIELIVEEGHKLKLLS